ncbi:hypothetical protein [Amycolatopsis sp. FDAARGOS 1241]|uniref:hypothetical protein n=1 Tax=Amycolatopsis sp. FDAARGOS 1241 TaxID=2778070 RepID=UPI001950059B|nr:hypothetical protein [Amycolatopsis sp. FDAARGOS 1241]QRP45357.1 hypothetical protein I6J71_40435 [Amycolatopsis sp. FDAARGOS 1241]
MRSEPESAAAAFTRVGQDAVTYARRVAGTALARTEHHREENRELLKAYGRHRSAGGGEVTPSALRGAAQRFRTACGLPVPVEDPARSGPVVPPARPQTSDDEEDFSQLRILNRPT